MSLKSFHIIFIIVAFALTIGFGIWGYNQSLMITFASFLFGVGLVVYGFQVLKKFKTFS